MTEETNDKSPQESSTLYYVIGAVLLVVIVAAGYFLRPKPANTPGAATAQTVPVNTPTPGPITGLACGKQYYNPAISLPRYYFTSEGEDLMTTKKVHCTFTMNQAGKVVATTSAEATLVEAPGRGGGTFRCDTKDMQLEANIPTVVDVVIKNDKQEIAACTQNFVLPPQ
ncbi:hypothetical protein A2973_00980 [Candidatus Gottesmanbacteria bacterium RIFCSPLOWO2_01_FULL_49_10]|uniref:Uncharacterized protein n=1 Tax=Candidatus Gottesmanbacteria bacterium RIFCSPLOWO2_01_FULL_49_10 TaxID=1798396 RepID=A0A1F6B0J9_9BACT|nr:MAG: hypothetical protein A2973_00980 [Candidatus Gottesmanbacteria bacterium RIFCSPLOWO2_01_FULL_49_10]